MRKTNSAHAIDSELRNSDIEYCIDEYVRRREYRDILREKWFDGLTFEEIASKHHISVTVVKDIVYDIGDSVLMRAAREKEKPEFVEQIIRLLKTK